MSQPSDIEHIIQKIIAEHSLKDMNALSLDMSLDSLAIDSLIFVEIIYEIEEHFNIDFEFDPNTINIQSFGEQKIYDLVQQTRLKIAQPHM